MGLIDSLGFGKHSTFAAEIKIHELLQVPLRDAKFRLKWHFKDATTHGVAVTQYAESLVSRSDESHHISAHFAEAGRRLLHPVNALVDSALGEHNKLETSRSQSPGGGNSSGNDGLRTPNILSPVMSPQLDSTTPNPNKTPMPQSIQFSSPFGRTGTQNTDESSTLARPSRTRTGDSQAHSFGSGPSHSDDGALGRRRGGGDLMHTPPLEASSQHRLEPKGTTNFVPLRSHTATFERTIVCPVQISARQNPQNHRYLLQPSSFKISIKQDGIDRNGHQQPEEKIGEVVLDLSQFVGKEVKSRRFLLGNCKTNSILRITVKMDFLEGENHYVAPPLVNGRITSTSKSNSSSARNSPANRSSTSLASSPRKTPSALSHGFSPSLQMSRSASTTSSINSSSTSLNERSRTSSKNDSLNHLTKEELRKHHKSRNQHHNRVVGPNGRREGWHPPASSEYSGCQHGERNATEIIESIFNRQPETPMTGKAAWHTHSGANTKPSMTPRQSYVAPASGAKENGTQAEKAAQSKKAAWSIRSFTRSRKREPPQRQSSVDTPSLAPSTSTTSSAPRGESGRNTPSVSVHPPSSSDRDSAQRPYSLERAGLSFASSTGSTQRAPSPPRSPRLSASTSSNFLQQTPRAPSQQRTISYSSISSGPPPLSSSQSSTTSSRPLSVRFDTDNESPRSLRSRTSTDNLSQHSNHSSSSVQGLGLSDSTLASASNGLITPRSSLDLNRTRSNGSFNSIVTPPSPERTPMRQRIASSDSWRR